MEKNGYGLMARRHHILIFKCHTKKSRADDTNFNRAVTSHLQTAISGWPPTKQEQPNPRAHQNVQISNLKLKGLIRNIYVPGLITQESTQQ